ncbi:MAG: hypothetical protein AAB436_02385 [Patescibacteria group bacterium]
MNQPKPNLIVMKAAPTAGEELLKVQLKADRPEEYVITHGDIMTGTGEYIMAVRSRLYNALEFNRAGSPFIGAKEPIISRQIEGLGRVFSYVQLDALTHTDSHHPRQNPPIAKYHNIGGKAAQLLRVVVEQKSAAIDAAS